ncbi:MAG: FtsX-like permease family protein, partial [Alphaproteobacteria bacterium]|nr:FtsX-like permease family protein [Alphaproteobacteria bacterium]
MSEPIRILLPLAWRNLWRNPRRTIITILVVSVGLWSILIFSVMLRAWSQSSRDTTLRLLTGEGQIHAAGYLDDPTAAHRFAPPSGHLLRLLESPAVKAFAARVRVSAIIQSEYKTLPVTFVGVVPDQERKLSVLPNQITRGRYLNGSSDASIVLGRDLAKRLKTRVGKRVVVMTQAADGHLAEQAFRVVGLFASTEQAEDTFAFTGIVAAQTFTGVGNGISEIAFDGANNKALSSLITDLRRAAPNLDVRSWMVLEPLVYAVSTFFNDFILMWLWVMFTLMTIGIVNTQLMAVFERTREFGLLQALGMRPRLVLLEVALESALLIGVGVAVGAVLSVATVQLFPDGIDLGFLGRGAEF